MMCRHSWLALTFGLLLSSTVHAEGVRVQRPGEPAREFILDRVLRHGANSQAYLAHDRETGKPAVVKLQLPERVGKKSDGFDKESLVLAAARARGAAVPETYGVGASTGPEHQRAIAIQLVRGERLSAHMQREPGKAARITMRVLESLEKMHASGWVHRDIKGDNVYIDHNKSASTTLLDVGNARKVDPAGVQQDIRDAAHLFVAMVVGKNMHHPPPEVIEQVEDALSPVRALRADGEQTSFGGVLRDALAGRYPSADTFRRALQPFRRVGEEEE